MPLAVIIRDVSLVGFSVRRGIHIQLIEVRAALHPALHSVSAVKERHTDIRHFVVEIESMVTLHLLTVGRRVLFVELRRVSSSDGNGITLDDS